MSQQSTKQDGKEALAVAQSILDESRHMPLMPWDIALLVLLWNYIQTQRNLIFTISEQELRSLSARLDQLASRDPQGTEKRHTDSISRLIKSECIARSDMSRLLIDADTEYQLTSLGESIASWHFEHDKFSGEPLTAILKAFNTHLVKIALDAEESTSAEDWQTNVLLQMQVVLKDMLVNVHRHQRELDRQHDHLRKFIPSLLTESSEVSIQFCEDQLANVISTINDLQEVTLAAANTAFQRLEQIENHGTSMGYQETDTVCGEIERRLNSVIQWTTQRASDWVEHHNVVHEFLRTIVYIDRNRRITEALKHAVAAEPRWTLSLVAEPPLIRLREIEERPRLEKMPRRPKRDYFHTIEEVSIDEVPEKLMRILNGEDIREGICLTDMLKQACVKEGVPEGRVIFHLPLFFNKLVRMGKVDNRVRPWEKVTERLDVEELRVIEHDIRKR